ncbi:hypothetical protein LAZ67_3005538 [Cordylochernes scorpioides]|uniref:C2H2-type domain-containing protein n=1 Tax=Cordylochernes scorpioides TaxID=51811 RepID=A0ABY6KDE7_9ARAC|nr:hypothetical protein LAZ67_3005538 [Cordylochernes scorpioides]
METCKYCGKQLEYKSQLIDHEKTHTGEREFTCDRKEKPFKCDRCNYKSYSKIHLRVHIRKHTNSKPYICDLCGFQTSYSGSLNGHKRNKHTDPALKCKLCKYVARGKADLRSHACKESLCLWGVWVQDPVQVPIHQSPRGSQHCPLLLLLCGTRSKSKTYFTAHMKNKHQVLNINIEEYITPVTTSFFRVKNTSIILYIFIRSFVCVNIDPSYATTYVHYSSSGKKSKSKTDFTKHMKNKHQNANSCRNWADCPELNDQLPDGEDGIFTTVGGSKKRPHDPDHVNSGAKKGCVQAPRIAPNSSRPRATPRASRVHECQTTRQKQATFRARSAAMQADQCVYLEFCPDFTEDQYFLALEAKLGKGTVYQLTKMEGQILVGLSGVQQADKLVEDGLEIEDALLRATPLKKRAERIMIGNVSVLR